MDSATLVQLAQRSLRITLGATTSLAEAFLDPQKRDQNFSRLSRLELDELTQEWAEKGEVTELEARNFINGLLTQLADGSRSQPGTSTTSPVSTTSTAQLELQELTAQLSAIRVELEKLRSENT